MILASEQRALSFPAACDDSRLQQPPDDDANDAGWSAGNRCICDDIKCNVHRRDVAVARGHRGLLRMHVHIITRVTLRSVSPRVAHRYIYT